MSSNDWVIISSLQSHLQEALAAAAAREQMQSMAAAAHPEMGEEDEHGERRSSRGVYLPQHTIRQAQAQGKAPQQPPWYPSG